jgi:hypothetical protein
MKVLFDQGTLRRLSALKQLCSESGKSQDGVGASV